MSQMTEKENIWRLLLPSVLGLLLCVACLLGSTLAWYSGTGTAVLEPMEFATFGAQVQVGDLQPENGVYTLPAGTHTVSLTPTGTATKGYCIVDLDGQLYYTPILTEPFNFKIHTAGESDLTVRSYWGTYGVENKNLLTEGQVLGQAPAEGNPPPAEESTPPADETPQQPSEPPAEAAPEDAAPEQTPSQDQPSPEPPAQETAPEA